VKNMYVKYYACTTAPQLFTHYKIDTATYALDGHLGASVGLSANYHPGGRTLMIGDATKGISFEYWILGGFSGVVSGGLPLVVNGETCSFGPDGTSEITVYRDDNVAGGITEGWFAIDYIDPRSVSHTASGNFRVEIKN